MARPPIATELKRLFSRARCRVHARVEQVFGTVKWLWASSRPVPRPVQERHTRVLRHWPGQHLPGAHSSHGMSAPPGAPSAHERRPMAKIAAIFASSLPQTRIQLNPPLRGSNPGFDRRSFGVHSAPAVIRFVLTRLRRKVGRRRFRRIGHLSDTETFTTKGHCTHE